MLNAILLPDIVLNLKYIQVEILLLIKHYHIIILLLCYLISPRYLFNNHKLYTDNYYTSLKLVTDLNKKKTYLIGTIKKNARGVSDMMSQKINVGESIKLVNSDGIVVCRFEI